MPLPPPGAVLLCNFEKILVLVPIGMQLHTHRVVAMWVGAAGSHRWLHDSHRRCHSAYYTASKQGCAGADRASLTEAD